MTITGKALREWTGSIKVGDTLRVTANSSLPYKVGERVVTSVQKSQVMADATFADGTTERGHYITWPKRVGDVTELTPTRLSWVEQTGFALTIEKADPASESGYRPVMINGTVVAMYEHTEL